MLFLLTVVLVARQVRTRSGGAGRLRQRRQLRFLSACRRGCRSRCRDAQYLLTFAVMLAVALIIGQMTAGLRYQARVASYREERARALYEFARDLSSLLQTEQVVETATTVHRRAPSAPSVAMLIPDDQDRLVLHDAGGLARYASTSRAAPVGVRQVAAGRCRHRYASPAANFCICRCARRCARAACSPSTAANRRLLMVPEQRRHLDTFAALAAIALERVHYVEVAQQALIQMESERLRNSLLAALSHDLRTPLAARRRAGRVARADQARSCPACSSTPRRRSPRKRAG